MNQGISKALASPGRCGRVDLLCHRHASQRSAGSSHSHLSSVGPVRASRARDPSLQPLSAHPQDDVARLRGAAVLAQEDAAAAAVTAAPGAGGGAGTPARAADAGAELGRMGERVAHVEAGLVEVRLESAGCELRANMAVGMGERHVEAGPMRCAQRSAGCTLSITQQCSPVHWRSLGGA